MENTFEIALERLFELRREVASELAEQLITKQEADQMFKDIDQGIRSILIDINA